jgi:hypothetical protein
MFTHWTLALKQAPNLQAIAKSFLDSEATKKKARATCDVPDDVQYNDTPCTYIAWTQVNGNCDFEAEAYGAQVRNFAGSAEDCAARCSKYTYDGFYYSCWSYPGAFGAECRW